MNSANVIVKDLRIMVNAINYRAWIYSQFGKYLGQRIIEIGGGIGNFTELFLNRELILTVDTDNSCVEYLKERFHNHKNVIPLKMDVACPEILDLSHYNPDTVVCINVLEHVKDDAKTLSYMFKILKKSGRLVLLVPAFPFLYGTIDRTVGHYRRYTKKELKEKLIMSGFDIKKIFYMNSIGMIGWFLNNRLFLKKEESPVQVMFFDRFIVPWLKSIEQCIRPPFGQSLVAICEKNEN